MPAGYTEILRALNGPLQPQQKFALVAQLAQSKVEEMPEEVKGEYCKLADEAGRALHLDIAPTVSQEARATWGLLYYEAMSQMGGGNADVSVGTNTPNASFGGGISFPILAGAVMNINPTAKPVRSLATPTSFLERQDIRDDFKKEMMEELALMKEGDPRITGTVYDSSVAAAQEQARAQPAQDAPTQPSPEPSGGAPRPDSMRPTPYDR